jgi:hypothetical protein
MNDKLMINAKFELKTMIDDDLLCEEQLLPLSKKMTKSFKRYWLEHLISESPVPYDGLYITDLDNWSSNSVETAIYNKSNKGKLVGEFYHNSLKILIFIYEYIDDKQHNILEYTLMPESKNMILGRVKLIIKKIDNIEYYFTNGLWNHKSEGTGIVYNFFINWLLPKYKTIISDNSTSKLGENFWWKIIEYGLANNKECGKYIDPESLIEPIKGFMPLTKKKEFLDAWKHNICEKRIYIKE